VKRPPGRPPNDPSGAPSAAIHLKLSPSLYDKADKVAKTKRESIQDTIRRALKRFLEDERG
jgi:hypothetical protein